MKNKKTSDLEDRPTVHGCQSPRWRKEKLDSYDFKRKEKGLESGLQNFECDQQKQCVEKF